MGAQPKRKVSRRRRDNRRQHQKLVPVQLVSCQQCRRLILPHHACPHCGTYRGRQVLKEGELVS